MHVPVYMYLLYIITRNLFSTCTVHVLHYIISSLSLSLPSLSFYSAKLNLENSHGDTALDIARNWGDDIIYAMVYAVAAKQPPPEGDGMQMMPGGYATKIAFDIIEFYKFGSELVIGFIVFIVTMCLMSSV